MLFNKLGAHPGRTPHQLRLISHIKPLPQQSSAPAPHRTDTTYWYSQGHNRGYYPRSPYTAVGGITAVQLCPLHAPIGPAWRQQQAAAGRYVACHDLRTAYSVSLNVAGACIAPREARQGHYSSSNNSSCSCSWCSCCAPAPHISYAKASNFVALSAVLNTQLVALFTSRHVPYGVSSRFIA